MSLKAYTPVVVFVYNRPEHTKKCIDALLNNTGIENTKVYFFSDAAKDLSDKDQLAKVDEVRRLVSSYSAKLDLELIPSKENKGLANSVIDGVSFLVKRHGKIIVLEDDLVTSPYFLTYMNDCLDFYKDNKNIMHVGAYSPPVKFKTKRDVYFLSFATSWGWATWDDRWAKFVNSPADILSRIDDAKSKIRFDFNNSIPFHQMLKDQEDKRIDSWAIRWLGTVFVENGLGVYPVKSLLNNIGFDGSGVHCGTGNWYDIKKTSSKKLNIQYDINKEDTFAVKAYEDFYHSTNRSSLWDKVKDKTRIELKNAKSITHKYFR